MTSAQSWWKQTSSGIRARWQNTPKAVRVGLIVLFVVFLYVLPNKGFYEYLNIPGVWVPLYTTGTEFPSALFTATWMILLTLGLNIVCGYAGLLDLGFFGFFAVGAYTVALMTSPESKLITEYNWFKSPWPWLVSVPIAIALALLSGVLLGWPTLRLRGDYLAIVTLGFAEVIRIIAKNQDWILNGDRGINEVARPPGRWPDGTKIFGLIDTRPYYWLGLTLIIVVVFFSRNLVRSRVGRAWVAIREDEDAAELMGVPTFKFKLWAFAMGAAIGGLSGSLWAGQNGFVNSGTFTLENSILVLAALLLGGAGSIPGAILGGFLVSYVPDWLRSLPFMPDGWDVTQYRFLVFGIILVVMMIFKPGGIWPNRRRVAEFKDRQKEVAVGV